LAVNATLDRVAPATRFAYFCEVQHVVGLLIFLLFAEDSGCAYAARLGAPLGWVLTVLITPLPIKIRPVDILFALILLATMGRKTPPLTPTMKTTLLTTAAVTVWCFGWGMVRGGDSRFASWQVYLILSMVLMTFTVARLFVTPSDFILLAKWLMAAAVYRGLGCWISYFTWGRSTLGEGGAYLTSHDDTIGWVVSILILLAHILHKRKAATTLRDLLYIGFFVCAIQFNSRRLAWVSLIMGLVVFYFLFPPGKIKTRINRALTALGPLLLLYVVVGWGRGNAIFLPLRSLSTVSTQEDASTLARNAENLGLIATANSGGFFFGTGWGHPYICLTRKYDIASAFELWQYVPHNSILGLLAFTGVLGFAGFWMLFPVAVYLNARVAKMAADPLARLVALIGAAQLIVCVNQFYGDMGIFFFKPMYVTGISCAIALRLPAITGVLNTASAPAAKAARPRRSVLA
jgi:hypothetical protein